MFCMIYAKGVEPGSPTQQGLRFGILAAFFVVIGTQFLWLALAEGGVYDMEMSLAGVLKTSAFSIVEFAILGIITAHLSGASSGGSGDGTRGGTGSGDKDKSDPVPPPSPTGG